MCFHHYVPEALARSSGSESDGVFMSPASLRNDILTIG